MQKTTGNQNFKVSGASYTKLLAVPGALLLRAAFVTGGILMAGMAVQCRADGVLLDAAVKGTHSDKKKAFSDGHDHGKQVAAHVSSSIESSPDSKSHAEGIATGAGLAADLEQKAAQAEEQKLSAKEAFLHGHRHGASAVSMMHKAAHDSDDPKEFAKGIVVGAEKTSEVATAAAASEDSDHYMEGVHHGSGAKKSVADEAVDKNVEAIDKKSFMQGFKAGLSHAAQSVKGSLEKMPGTVSPGAKLLYRKASYDMNQAYVGAKSAAELAFEKAKKAALKAKNFVESIF